MTIEKELERLVQIYAKFDSQKKCYESQLNKDALLSLDRDFAKLINQQLLADGPSKERITARYRKVCLKFHPDRQSDFSPEIKWIEENLSSGKNDGSCFKSLNFCYEKLITPEKFKNITFGDIKSKEDFKKWLEELKNQASTYTGKSLYTSLTDLLDQSSGFFDDAGKIKPTGMRVLITSLPVLFASYGTFIFAEELFAVYALYFVVLKGGQYLERSNSSELRSFGKALQEISAITATATTTLIVRLLEMTFWASRQCLDVSLQIGSAIFTPLLPVPPVKKEWGPGTEENLCRDILLASQNLNEGIQFNTPELKVISAPLESYLGLNSQQFLLDWRKGKDKRIAVEAFLFRMRVLDVSPEPIEVKLLEAKKELDNMKKKSGIYTSQTAEAVDRAEMVLDFLQDPEASDKQLVVYNPK